MIDFIHSMLNLKKISPAKKIAASFLLVILTGALLLMLPISTKNGDFFSPLDALFISTSATCVTGLSTVTVADTFNLFGQFVILMLIQIGGLGLMTFMAVFVLIMRNRLSMNEKIVMKEMLNQSHVVNMKRFLLDILYYTLFFEACGAVLIAFRMIPRYGLLDGGFKAIFLSISAFCNAGFDTLGSISLQGYVHDPLMCFTIMALIVLGGIGFAVWFDIRDKIKPLLNRDITFAKFKHSLTLHTKVVVVVTLLLIFIPALIILLLEYNNSATMGNFNIFEKMMTATFESIALRTAGFSSINYGGLYPATDLLMMAVMFVGGSPGGTAGGIKTTTFAVIVIYMINVLKGREQTIMLKRTIRDGIVIRAMGIFFMNLIVLFTGIFLLNVFENQPFLSLAFEAGSAMATVGASLGITSALGVGGKFVIILLMYIGRIGISTLILSLMKPKVIDSSMKISYPNGNIIVG